MKAIEPSKRRITKLFFFFELKITKLSTEKRRDIEFEEVMDVSGSLSCVVVAVDGSEVSMEALRWALDNLKLSSSSSDSSFVLLHVQPSPSVAAGVSPGTIPFGGPS